MGEKQPHCNEIIHFKSSEFKDGKPKTLETLNKITELVNRELPPLLHAEKKIGMGTNTNAIPAVPAIGFVDASVTGVAPGHQLHANELKEILTPIHPASIKSRQVVEQKLEKKQECKSNCSCKKQENSDNNSDTTEDDCNDKGDDESDVETEEENSEEQELEGDEDNGSEDDDDDDRLQVDDVSEHLVPVHGFQGGVSDMNHMIRVTGEDLVAVKCSRLKKLLAEVRSDLVGSDYENVVHGLTILVNQECSGIISPGEEEEELLRNQQLRMLERSPVKKSLLAEISLLTNEISDELYRVREIFTRLTNIEDHKNLTTTLNRLEQEKLIDAELNKKLSALSNISYTELRKLLVTAKPELLQQQINYAAAAR